MKVLISRYPKDSSKARNIQIHIDNYDTWDAFHTLALIIHPLLIKLKELKNGAAFVADEDVPEAIRSTSAKPKENSWDTDEFVFARWDYVLDEIIWAVQEIANGNPGEGDFHDYSAVPMCIDCQGLEAYHKRLQKGCELFGKYFMNLWN